MGYKIKGLLDEEKLAQFPRAIPAQYSMEGANEDITLGKYTVEIIQDSTGKKFQSLASFTYLWQPYPRVDVQVNCDSIPDFQEGEVTLRLLEPAGMSPDPKKISIYDTRYAIGKAELKCTIDEPLFIGNEEEPSFVHFHIPNFFNYLGSPIADNDSLFYGRAMLKDQDYEIIIDKVSHYDKLRDSLRRNGGSALTHTAIFLRKDEENSKVLYRDFLNQKPKINKFLSFLIGSQIEIALPQGIIEDDERTWKLWEPLKSLNSRIQTTTFFNYKVNVKELSSLYECFSKTYDDPVWKNPLSMAIDIYCESNRRSSSLMTCINSNQVIFELLSRVKFFEIEQSHTEHDYRNMWASEKIIELLQWANKPIDIPPSLSELKKIAEEKSWENAPHALTAIRNSFVHPRNEDLTSIRTAEIQEEAWKLGLYMSSCCYFESLALQANIMTESIHR